MERETPFVKTLARRLKHRFDASKFTTSGNVDLEQPSPLLNTNGLKIAVYSCVTGDYDNIIEPLCAEPGIEYFMFTDGVVSSGSKWTKIDTVQFKEDAGLSPLQLNRKIKMLPFRYLPEYDYSIYIDGNIKITAPLRPLIAEMGDHGFGVHYHRTRDCIYDELIQVAYLKKADVVLSKQQIASYKKEGFPQHFGLYENSILIRKHGDKEVQKLMGVWWDEYLKYPTRDQFSLPYIIWKTGYDRGKIHILGNNLNKNPRFKREPNHKYNS